MTPSAGEYHTPHCSPPHAAPASLSSSAHCPSSSLFSSLYWFCKVFPDLYLKKKKVVFHILPSMTLSNPITCGHFSTPDTSSSFHRLKHRETLQRTRRTGSLSLPTAEELRCLFLHARRKDSTGYQRMGWLIELSTAVLGSGWTARIYLYSLTTAAAISFLALL